MTTATDTIGRECQVKVGGVVKAEFHSISWDFNRDEVPRDKFGVAYPNRSLGNFTPGRATLKQPNFKAPDYIDFLRSGSSFVTKFETKADSKGYTMNDCYVLGVSGGGDAGSNIPEEEITISFGELTEDLT